MPYKQNDVIVAIESVHQQMR